MGISGYPYSLLLGIPLAWAAYYLLLAWRGLRLTVQEPAATNPSTPEELPSVTLVIPAKDEAVVVEEAILQALSFTYPEGRKDIVLVEDGSRDDTPDICRRYAARYGNITLVHGGVSRGKPAALNRAMAHTKGDVVAFLDADARARPDLLLQAVQFLRDQPEVDALQAIPETLNGDENLITRLDSLETSFWYGGVQRAKDAMGLFVHLCGSGMFLRRSTLEELGSWDDRCLGEDVEYSTRLVRAGKRLRVVPIKVWRQPPFSAKAFLKQRMRWWGGVFQALAKDLQRRGVPRARAPLRIRLDMYIHLCSPLVLLGTFVGLVIYGTSLLLRAAPLPPQAEVLPALLSVNLLLAGVALSHAWARRDLQGLAVWPGMYYYWALQMTAMVAVLVKLLRGRGVEWERTEKRGLVWEV